MIQVDDVPVEVVGPERAGLARGIAGPGRGRRSAAGIEHRVVDDQLAPSLEQLAQGPLAARPLEHVGLCDRFPRQPASLLARSEEHTSELQSLAYLVCRLLLEKKKNKKKSKIR